MTLTATSACVGGRHVALGMTLTPKPAPAPAEPAAEVDRFASLSRRERQVLDVYMDVAMAKIVAVELGISIKTVEVHLVRIREKTGYSRCIHLARAYERSLMASQGDQT